MTYYSQYGQDKIVDSLLKNKSDGFFLDIGAHDGISLSNTYFFEKERNWKGICFEPHPKVFQTLVKNRSCDCVNKGVGDSTEFLEFWEISGYAEMLSGFKNNYTKQHIKRIESEIVNFGGFKEIKNIEIIKLTDFLIANSINSIDYLSIDTEGGEDKILYSIDFSKISVNVLTVENNYNDQKIIDYMKKNGYRHEKIHIDDVYYK